MKHRILAVTAILIAVAACLAFGEKKAASSSRTMTIEEAVAAALASDEGIKQAAISLATKKRAVDLAWNELLPTIKASGGLSPSASLASSSSAALAATGSVSASLSLSGSLEDDKSLAQLQYEGQELAYEKARAQVELSVRKKALSVLLAEESLKLAQQNITRQADSYAQTEAKYKAGLAPEIDLLTAKVSLETLKPAAQDKKTSLANDLDELKQMIGLADGEEIEISGSLEASDAAIAAVVAAAASSADSASRSVATAEKTLRIAEANASSLERAFKRPSLSLSASVSPNTSLSTASGFGAGLSVSASAMVGISLDRFLEGSSERKAIADAKDSVASAESALKQATASVRLSKKSGARSVEGYRASLEAIRLNIELAQKSYDATQESYKKGYATLSSLQSAAGSLESAKYDALSKSYDLIAALLDLEYEAGLALDTMGRY